MGKAAPVVMIGLDAAESTVVERLCCEGKLPTLDSLRQSGCFGCLEAQATIFSGGVWPTFYTAKRVPWHGIYHDRLWRHDKMRFEMAHDRWLPTRPFWELLDREYRVAIVDVPMVLRAPGSMNGILISGWRTHDRVFAGTRPRGLAAKLEREFGSSVMSAPFVRPRTAGEFLRLRDRLVATTEQLAQLSKSLLVRGPWDVFCVVFGAPHRGGHHLWDLSQIERSGISPLRRELEHALEDVYKACDRAVRDVIEGSPKEARILVFAAHGMGPNPGWNDRCEEIVSTMQGARPADAKGAYAGSISGLRKRVGEALFPHLPRGVRNHLVNRRLTNRYDWNTTRYFPLDMDHAGYLRINLIGREPRGIVQPGPEYRAVCDELGEAFSSLRDIETDEAIVDKVYRLEDLAPEGAPHRERLPDLVITWGARSAVQSRGIYGKRYGELRWNGDGVLPSLRSGNHRDKGWFIAVGSGIERGSRSDGHHISDLVPTVFQWIGARRGEDFQGRPIPALCGPVGA